MLPNAHIVIYPINKKNDFNLVCIVREKLSQNYEDPLIVHFVGDLKPWGETVIPTWTNKWRELQKKLNN